MKTITLAVLLFAFALPAFAADEPKKIDFTQVLMSDDGPIVDDIACPPDRVTGVRPCDTPITLGETVYRALNAPERDMTWEEGLKRSDLARALRKKPDWPLLPADRELVKKQIARVFPFPMTIAAAARLLAGEK